MNQKTRFESLSKQDREAVMRIKGVDDELESHGRELVNETFALLQQDTAMPRRWSPRSQLKWMLEHLQREFFDRAIIHRLLADDPAEEVIEFRTSARIGYLLWLVGGHDYSGGYDCAHIFDMLTSIASKDSLAVAQYAEQFPPPFKSGHPSTVLLANGVYSVLARDQARFQVVREKLKTRKESRFFRAMYDCLLAIMAEDVGSMCHALEEMLQWNRRQEQHQPLRKLICIPAHAMYNMCLDFFAERGRTPPPVPQGDAWDDAFHFHAHQADRSGDPHHCDLSSLNPLLAQWVNELRLTIDVKD